MQTVSPPRDTASVRPVIRIYPAGWQTLCKRHHLDTDRQKADFLGVTRQSVNEMQNGKRGVSVEFIAAVLTRFVVPFEAVFTVEIPRQRKSAA